MVNETTPRLSDAAVNGPSYVPGLVPADRSTAFRTLILCFDGTGDKDDGDVTNVIELRNMLYGWDNDGDGDPQLQQVYYQRGIGTYNAMFPNTNVKIPIIGSVSETVDQAIAWSIKYHIIEGYKWLAERYRPGDKICLFGFSRGAHTARALAGMLSKVGLIPADSPKGTGKRAFRSYKVTGKGSWDKSKHFRHEMKCRDVTVEFLGCWDTVSSVGLAAAKTLPYTTFNWIVSNFRHAVSLDEHRARFKMHMWRRQRETNTMNGNDVKNGHGSNGTTATGVQTNGGEAHNRDIHGSIINGKHHIAPTGEDLDAGKPEGMITVPTDADQVWFAGCHCDIGGGSVPNGTRPNLAHIPLRWMIREIFKTNAGIIFKKASLVSFGLRPETLYPTVQKRPAALTPEPSVRALTKPAQEKPGRRWNPFAPKPKPEDEKPTSGFEEGYDTMSEEQLDLQDALAPIYDQLVLKHAKWWPLEVYPMKVWSVSMRKYVLRQNYGRGRHIPPPPEPEYNTEGCLVGDPRWYKVRVHSSVRTRMETVGDDESRYEPKAMLNGKEGETLSKLIAKGIVEWVD